MYDWRLHSNNMMTWLNTHNSLQLHVQWEQDILVATNSACFSRLILEMCMHFENLIKNNCASILSFLNKTQERIEINFFSLE